MRDLLARLPGGYAGGGDQAPERGVSKGEGEGSPGGKVAVMAWDRVRIE